MSSVAGLPVLFMYLSRRLILAFDSFDFGVCSSANVVVGCIVTTDTTVKSTDRTDKTDKDADI